MHYKFSPRHVLVALLFWCHGITAAADTDYIPIQKGYEWRYAVTIEAANGKIISGKSIVRITGTKKLAGKEYYVSTTTFVGLPGMDTFTVYRRKTAYGVYAINSFDPKKKEYLETRFPMKIGAKWTSVTHDKTIQKIVRKENIRIAGKEFTDCLRITRTADSNSPSGVYYVAPDVGLIKDEATQNGISYKFVLTEFFRSKPATKSNKEEKPTADLRP